MHPSALEAAYPVSLRAHGVLEWEDPDGQRHFLKTYQAESLIGAKDYLHRLQVEHQGERWVVKRAIPAGALALKRPCPSWPWPLAHRPEWPGAAGSFAAVRKFDIHTGVDLYCPEGTSVLACEPGIVVRVEDFTGPKAGSPWWNATQAVLVKGDSGIICYGEVTAEVEEGMEVSTLQRLGTVKQVLKRNKGKPMSMLHVELYDPETFAETVVWPLGKKQPTSLLDPTRFLQGSLLMRPSPCTPPTTEASS